MLKRKWVLLCCLLPCVLFAQIRIDSRTVEVYVSVTDAKGKPVTSSKTAENRSFEFSNPLRRV